MKAWFSFAWMAGFAVLALFFPGDTTLLRWFIVVPAIGGLGMALASRSVRTRRYFTLVATLAGTYSAIILGSAWLAGVTPDYAALRTAGPYLLAGMVAPACCLEIGPLPSATWKWIWLGLILAAGLVIEANNLHWIDYRQLQAGDFRIEWNIWSEKYYIYAFLLLFWPCVAFFSWRRKIDRLLILGLLGLATMVIWNSGRSARSLGILACGVAAYAALNTFRLSPRVVKAGLVLLVLWWGGAPWLFKALDFSRVDPRVEERTHIYRAAHDLIMQRPWTGHGFGQGAQLTHPELPKRFERHFPGGHPHNLGLLFWIEYGLVGAVFLCAVSWYLLRRIVDLSCERPEWPALAALLVTFVAMVSFSWDVWIYSVILFYAVFAALVVMILNVDERLVPESTTQTLPHPDR